MVWEVDYIPLDTTLSDHNTHFYKIHDVGDGYVAAGANWDAELPAGEDGYLVKVSYDGEKIWERKYHVIEIPTSPTLHEFYDMRPTSDGGYIMAGQVLDFSQSLDFQQGWLVKVDEYGCLVPNCQLADAISDPFDNSPTINLYPNPTSDFLNIYFSHINKKDGVFRLIDLQGRTVLQFDANKNETTYIVSLEKYAAGIYFLQYVEEGVIVK